MDFALYAVTVTQLSLKKLSFFLLDFFSFFFFFYNTMVCVGIFSYWQLHNANIFYCFRLHSESFPHQKLNNIFLDHKTLDKSTCHRFPYYSIHLSAL